MARLNTWQKISRVESSDWGTGADGNVSLSTDPNTRATLTGTGGTNSSTIGSAILSNNDIVVLHQTQGTGAGQWEINKVASGGGTTSITWYKPLKYTYTTGAQVIKFLQYDTVTIGSHSIAQYSGGIGGIEVICGKTSITVSGTINGNGSNGLKSGDNPSANVLGTGFSGGYRRNGDNTQGGRQGEGISGTGSEAYQLNSNGGGAGKQMQTPKFTRVAGGGGGNGGPGGNGSFLGDGSASMFGVGGDCSGTPDLTIMSLGGGGGGSKMSNGSEPSGTGGSGAGILILISKDITISSSVTFNGGAGGASDQAVGGGGGGAGGSVLLYGDTVSLGSNNITALGGTSSSYGGGGGVGRIAVHYVTSVSGTTNPNCVAVNQNSNQVDTWQRVDRVIPSQPFGDGKDGSITISSDPNTRWTVTSGTATQNSITVSSNSMANGDLVIIHQTQGTGAGQWELNRITSGGGTTTLNLQKSLQYSYTTGAQIFSVPRYTTATINSTTITGWDGSKGGILALCANTSVTISGTVTANGKGFRALGATYKGESPTGVGTAHANLETSPNGSGGGSSGTNDPGCGAGGSYDGIGGYSGYNDQTLEPTNPNNGSFISNKSFLGSAGGGGAQGTGGYGGGIVLIFAKNITVSASLNVSGGDATSSHDRPGGGGAGGFVGLYCKTANIGSNNITSSAGNAGSRVNSWNGYPTNGTSGRIAIFYSDTITGSSTPIFYDIPDNTLIDAMGGSFIFNLI